MKILFVASEAEPLAKVGGLADVVGSLPKALRTLGEDVRTVIPQYDCIDTARFPLTGLNSGYEFSLAGETYKVALNLAQNGGVPVYTLENRQYFGTREIYVNELERFYFFSRAVFEMLPRLDWQPDIVHCHDWLTALVVMWLKKAGNPYSTLFTIHNVAYQGPFDEAFARLHQLDREWDDSPPGAPPPPRCFLGQAILHANQVNAVSETFSREITTPESGCGLDALLRYRLKQGDLSGILNGIDCEYWNPAADSFLTVNFDHTTLASRAMNKAALQRRAGLPVDNEIPLIGIVQRMEEQKGIDILLQALDRILDQTGAQLVVQGSGREIYKAMLREEASRHPQQMVVFNAWEEPLAHLIYGGCDMFLMPSRFEPCGLGQMIAMRYGALPVVRHTGGLVDSVSKFSPDLSRGNGFIFHDYSGEALLKAVNQAAAAFKDKERWYTAVERVMQIDFSWRSPALKYQKIYQGLR